MLHLVDEEIAVVMIGADLYRCNSWNAITSRDRRSNDTAARLATGSDQVQS